MFDDISNNYDLLNKLLSFRIDILWRNYLIKQIQINNKNKKILDLATGTGDIAIAIAKKLNVNIIGFDISKNMLDIAKKKINKLNLQNQIKLIKGNAENMPFDSESFDLITVAFGIRNFTNLKQGLLEITRILKPNGQLYILEFSKSKNYFSFFLKFYYKNILPKIANLISKNIKAYEYLPNSIESFFYPEELIEILKKIGYQNIKYKKLTFGIVTLYNIIK